MRAEEEEYSEAANGSMMVNNGAPSAAFSLSNVFEPAHSNLMSNSNVFSIRSDVVTTSSGGADQQQQHYRYDVDSELGAAVPQCANVSSVQQAVEMCTQARRMKKGGGLEPDEN